MSEDVRPFEEYKEMIKDMRKEEMIKGLYDLSARITKQDKEIERLNDENKMLKEAVKEKVIATCNTCEDYGICPHSYSEYDLNNIINELEEELERESNMKEEDTCLDHNTFIDIRNTLKRVLKRLKELKELKGE